MKRLASHTPKEVRFELSAKPGSRVFVAGSFNHWDPTASPLKDNPDKGHYKAALNIPSGRHEYLFVVNGIWTMDPECADREPNTYGSLNGVLHI